MPETTTRRERRTRSRPRYADADKVRLKRVQAGLTQAELAQRTGVTQVFISAIELGKRGASIPTLHALAQVFGCDVAELMPETKKAS